MKQFPLLPYAVIGLALVAWWAFTQSPFALFGMVALLAVAAVHVVMRTGRPGSVASEQDKAEGHARASFPMPPERPGS